MFEWTWDQITGLMNILPNTESRCMWLKPQALVCVSVCGEIYRAHFVETPSDRKKGVIFRRFVSLFNSTLQAVSTFQWLPDSVLSSMCSLHGLLLALAFCGSELAWEWRTHTQCYVCLKLDVEGQLVEGTESGCTRKIDQTQSYTFLCTTPTSHVTSKHSVENRNWLQLSVVMNDFK